MQLIKCCITNKHVVNIILYNNLHVDLGLSFTLFT